MRFIPHDRNAHYKIFSDSGFYRSTVDSIPTYFQEYSRIQNDPSADMKDFDLFIFAMNYDFMSYVAQQVGGDLETGVTLNEGRTKLTDVIIKCDKELRYSNRMVSNEMIAVVKESSPEPKYFKDIESDYQVQRSVTWSYYTSNKKHLNAIRYKELLVQHMTTNDSDTFLDRVASHLRRGANAIQRIEYQSLLLGYRWSTK